MGPERLPVRLAFGWVDSKHRSGGQAASFASTTKEHLKEMNLPTDDKDWLPLTRNAREWSKLITKNPHHG